MTSRKHSECRIVRWLLPVPFVIVDEDKLLEHLGRAPQSQCHRVRERFLESVGRLSEIQVQMILLKLNRTGHPHHLLLQLVE
jgi:hypothetical protein